MWAMSESELHALVSGFEDAATYDLGRPLYGPAVAATLMEELELSSGAPVLELGPGTGQLSRALIGAGLDLKAVEPLVSMRELLAQAIGPERVHAGVAEEIPLPAESVEAVFAADSFHWFEPRRALPELLRVLRAGGGVAILMSVPTIWNQPAISREITPLVAAARGDHPAFIEGGPAAPLEDDDAFGPVRESSVTAERSTDREGLLAYVATISWVATMPEEARARLLESVEQALVREGVTELHYEVIHQIWTTRRL